MIENDKITLNEITIRAKIYDDTEPYLQDKSFGFDFYYGSELPPKTKDDTIRQLDARWEQMKAQIIKELYGE